MKVWWAEAASLAAQELLLIGVGSKPDALEINLLQKVLACHLNYFYQSTLAQLGRFCFFIEHCGCWDSACMGVGTHCCVVKCRNVLELEGASDCVRAGGASSASCYPKELGESY